VSSRAAGSSEHAAQQPIQPDASIAFCSSLIYPSTLKAVRSARVNSGVRWLLNLSAGIIWSEVEG
jgi:hypothetical protein